MSLLVVGSIGIDTVETPTQKRENLLGGSAVYFAYAASFYTKVHMEARLLLAETNRSP